MNFFGRRLAHPDEQLARSAAMTRTETAPEATDYRSVLGHFPTGVAVVAGIDRGGQPVGLTIQSFMALSLDPAMVLVSIDRRSTSWPAIAQTGHFVVNILSNHQEAIARSFARSGGPKFDGVSCTPAAHTGTPIIDGCQAWVECRSWQVYDGGDHEIVAAHVASLGAITDPDSHPLVFFRSKFPRFDQEHWTSISS
jgi:3-hydroxy-9,10-secoandrosta-1,3,5(10)-triene-9,17-dione monooxygenase reductase component